MRFRGRWVSVLAAVAATTGLAASPAAAAGPQKFVFSTSGLSADAVFSNAPSSGDLAVGRVYTDVFVFAADQATKSDGATYQDDVVFVDAYSYKIDRRGSYVSVSSTYGWAGGDQVDFTGDARRLSSAALTARLTMETCTSRGCSSAGAADVTVSWTGTGATSTYRGTYRSSDPGQFTSTSRFSGTSRQATASGTVPVLGSSSATWASLSYGTYSDRTICRAC